MRRLLAALSVILALTWGAEWKLLGGSGAPPAAVDGDRLGHGRQGGEKIIPTFSLLPLRDLDEITQRPLFTPDRRPAEAAVPVAMQSALPKTPFPAHLHLQGIWSVGGAESIMLEDSQHKEFRTLHVGEEIEGWKLRSVNTDGVVFSRGGVDEAVPLRVFHKVEPSGPPLRLQRRKPMVKPTGRPGVGP
jgi:hypothetical protein